MCDLSTLILKKGSLRVFSNLEADDKTLKCEWDTNNYYVTEKQLFKLSEKKNKLSHQTMQIVAFMFLFLQSQLKVWRLVFVCEEDQLLSHKTPTESQQLKQEMLEVCLC